jgi:hypothetical protein
VLGSVMIESRFHFWIFASGFAAVSGMAVYELWKLFALGAM